MPSTFVHALLPASCVVVAGRSLPKLKKIQWLKLVVLAAFFGNSPDLDIIPASLFPAYWSAIHRNWGHNIFFASFLVAISGPVIRRIVSKAIPWRLAYLMGGMLVTSHLVLDSMMILKHSTGGRPGVPLLWPLSSHDFHLPWAIFECIEYKNPIHPLVGYATSASYWQHIVYHEISMSLLLLGMWASALFLFKSARYLTNRMASRRIPTKGSATAAKATS